MTQPTNTSRSLIDTDAFRLAFRLGQRIGDLVLEKAEELARQRTTSEDRLIITTWDVRAAVERCLPEGLCMQLGVSSDGQQSERRSAA